MFFVDDQEEERGKWTCYASIKGEWLTIGQVTRWLGFTHVENALGYPDVAVNVLMTSFEGSYYST